MSMSPSNILAKLEELKKWQEKQQRRLLEHQQQIECNKFTSEECNFMKDSFGVDISSENNPKVNTKVFKNPIQETRTNESFTANNNRKPKQPFLRRGVGLARFRMTPGEQFKPFTKPFSNYKKSAVKVKLDTKQIEVENKINHKKTITPLKKPDLKVKSKAAWFAPSNKENEPLILNHNTNLVPLRVENVDNDRDHYPEPAEVNPNASDRELLIFETLEQRAMQNSFCSTNSSIVRLLSSTPHKNSPLKINGNNNVNNENVVHENHKFEQIYENGTQFEAVYDHQKTSEEDVMQLQCTRYDPKKQGVVIQEISDDNVKTVEDNAKKLQDINEYEKKIENDYLALIQKAIKFQRFVTGDKISNSSSSSVTSEDLEQATIEDTLKVETDFHDDKKWSDTESSVDEITISASKDWERTNESSKRDAETMTVDFTECTVNSLDNENSLLHNKLQELEAELKNIKLENAKINKLKNQLENQKREFEKHKKEIMKQIEDEKVRINFTLEEEKKKLSKEKMVFER